MRNNISQANEVLSFTENYAGLPLYAWIIIGVAVLAILIAVIAVVAVKNKKKKAESLTAEVKTEVIEKKPAAAAESKSGSIADKKDEAATKAQTVSNSVDTKQPKTESGKVENKSESAKKEVSTDIKSKPVQTDTKDTTVNEEKSLPKQNDKAETKDEGIKPNTKSEDIQDKEETEVAATTDAKVKQEPKKRIINLDESKQTFGKFVIKNDANNAVRPYHFCLLANNGQILFESEPYKAKPNKRSFDAFRKYAVNRDSFSIDEDKNGNFRYKLYNPANNMLVGVGESYNSKISCENSIESVIRFAESATIVEDLTVTDTEE